MYFNESTLQLAKNAADEILLKIRSMPKRPKFLVGLGDWTDNQRKLDKIVINACDTFLLKLAEIAPIYVLIGDRDVDNNTKRPCIDAPTHRFVNHMERAGIFIVDRPIVHSFSSNSSDENKPKISVGFAPYAPAAYFETMLVNNCPEYFNCTLAFSHQEFVGSETELTWKKDHAPMIAGYTHKTQRHGKIFYSGTPYQITYEEEENKGILLGYISPFAASQSTYGSEWSKSSTMSNKYYIYHDLNAVVIFEIAMTTTPKRKTVKYNGVNYVDNELRNLIETTKDYYRVVCSTAEEIRTIHNSKLGERVCAVMFTENEIGLVKNDPCDAAMFMNGLHSFLATNHSAIYTSLRDAGIM